MRRLIGVQIYIRNIRGELSSFLYTESTESGYWNPVFMSMSRRILKMLKNRNSLYILTKETGYC